MRKMKVLLALVLALALTMSVCSALAGSITITDDHPAGTDPAGTATTVFHYYGILRASINGSAVSYYLLDSEDDTLRTALDNLTITKSGSAVDVFTFTQSADGSRWIATLNTALGDADAEALAAAFDNIKSNAFAESEFTMSNGIATASVIDGYYLVTSSLGAKLVLDTFNTVSINTKNEYHTTVKTGSTVDMNVGDHITYTITVHVPTSAIVGDEITVHDTLDEHLAILDSTGAIAANAAAYAISATVGSDSVTLTDGTLGTGETFAKKFAVTAAMLDADVVLTYQAELLSTATDDTGYVNTAFSNTSTYETNPTTWRVYTFDIDLNKTFQGVQSTDANASDFSATFQLRTNADDASTAIDFIAGYEVADSDDTSTTTDLVVTAAAPINIKGLKAGTYYLVETATAAGYNLLTGPITVTITDTTPAASKQDNSVTPSHTVDYSYNGTSGSGTVEVQNSTGTELPSTGGIGTTIFYIAGIVLVLGAAAVVIARRKAEQE